MNGVRGDFTGLLLAGDYNKKDENNTHKGNKHPVFSGYAHGKPQ
jgi:hypothetical protein